MAELNSVLDCDFKCLDGHEWVEELNGGDGLKLGWLRVEQCEEKREKREIDEDIQEVTRWE